MEWLNRAGAVVGLLALLVSAVVYLYSLGKRGRQDVLRQDNADLRASNEGLRTELSNKVTIIEGQKDTINGLKDVATQTPAVNKLIEMITTQQKSQGDQHSEVIQAITTLTGKISDLAKAINKSHNKDNL